MASNRVYVDHLKKVDLFQQFSRKDLERVARDGVHLTLPAGKRIVEQGDEGGYEAFVVLTGTVQLKRNNRLVASLGSGSIIGELSLLDFGPRTATAVCETECDVLVLSRHGLRTLLDDVPALTHKIFASLASRIRDLDGKHYV